MASNLRDKSQAHVVASQLREEILRGQYRPKERLPSERDLAERFEVNRSAVREALKKLEQLGIADIRRGGARVVPLEAASLDVLGYLLDLDELPDPKLVGQVLEVHRDMMTTALRLAVVRGSDEELAAIRALLEHVCDPDPDADVSAEMHELAQLVISTSRNLVLRLVQNGLKTQFIGRLLKAGLNLRPRGALVLPLARSLDAAIANRDVAGATESAQKILELSSRQVMKALEQARGKDPGF